MKRKLVKQGAATMMISLPSKWIKHNSLDKGDEINLEEKENNLVITTEQTLKSKQEITIEMTKENRGNLKNILTHIYRRGFDKITIKNIDSDILKELRDIVQILLGFEIIGKDANKCVLENISEPTENKYESILKKVFVIIKEDQDIILNDFKTNKYVNKQEIEESRIQGDRFVLFCRRLLIKEKNEEDAVLEWELLTSLMRVHHGFYYMYKYASENNVKVETEVVELLGHLKDYFELFFDAYHNKNINSIHKINDLKKKYQFGKSIDHLERSKGKNTVLHSYIKECFRNIQLATSPIYGMIFDNQIKG